MKIQLSRLKIAVLFYYLIGIVLCSFFAHPIQISFIYTLLFIPFVLIKHNESPISVKNFYLIKIVWILSFSTKLIVLLNNGMDYPYSFSFVELNLQFISLICFGLLLSFSQKWGITLLSLELVYALMTLQRSAVLSLVMVVFFAIRFADIRFYLTRFFFPVLLVLISIVYVRTDLKTEDVDFSFTEFEHIVKSSVERITISFQTDIKAYQNGGKTFDIQDVAWSFVPRFLNPSKPNLLPGLQVQSTYWKDEVKSTNHIPIGFVGTSIAYFGQYFWIALIFLAAFFCGLIKLLHTKLAPFGWIGSFYVFSVFFLPEHLVFYLSAWIRLIPALGIVYLLIQWSIPKKTPLVLVSSQTIEFGGIQRLVELIRAHFSAHQIKFVELIYIKNSFWSKVSFVLKSLPYLLQKSTFLSSHLYFNEVLRFKNHNSKLISLLHGIELNHIKANELAAFSDTLFANSLETKSFLTLQKQIEIVRYPFLWVDKLDSGKKYQHILLISRISKNDAYKGVSNVIEAWEKIPDEFPKAKLLIVGIGDQRFELEHLVRQKNLTDSIRFHGFVSDEDLKLMYQQAYALILPSSREGQGLVYFEAMSAGLPVIGLKKGVLSEFITHEKQGLLIEQDSSSILEALRFLLANPQKQNEMGENAYQFAAEVYNKAEFFTLIEKEIAYVRNSGTNPIQE